MSVPAQIRSSPDVAETTLPQARIRKEQTDDSLAIQAVRIHGRFKIDKMG
jgi:hypothetical protein